MALRHIVILFGVLVLYWRSIGQGPISVRFRFRSLFLSAQPGNGSIQSVQTEVGVITWWVGADQFQGAQDVFRSGLVHGQMGSLWLETVLVGDVVHGVLDAVFAGVRVASLGRLAADAAFLGRDAVARFVPVLVGAIGVHDGILRQDLGLGVLGVLGGG